MFDVRRLSSGDRVALSVPAAVVGLTYWPVVWYRFGFVDDYTQSLWSGSQHFRFHTAMGRPLQGVFAVVGFGLTPHVSGFGVLRAWALLICAVQAGLLGLLLRCRGLRTATAIAISVAAFTTVGVQVVIAFSAVLLVATAGSLIAGIGGAVAWFGDASWRAGVLASACLFLGLASYQPSAMASVGVVLILLATSTDAIGTDLKRCVRVAATLGGAFVGYLLGWRIVQTVWATEGGRGRLVSDPWAKLDWFAEVVVLRVLHPYSISRGGWLSAALVATLIVASAVHRGDTIGAAASRAFATVLGLVAMLAPSLATEESWASARSMWTVMVTVVVLAGIGVARLGSLAPIDASSRTGRLLRSGVAFVVCAGCLLVTSHRVVAYFAEPLSVELRLIELSLDERSTPIPRRWS